MSFFKRMFGTTTADEERQEADRLFDAKNFFEARQAYERARGKRSDDGTLKEHCEQRIALCFDAMAEERIREAQRFRADGELEMARTELATAIELARSADVREKARRAVEMLERRDAIVQAADDGELSDEDRWAVIASNWNDDQLAEYDEYGEEFRDAVLALHDGRVEAARAVIEKLAEDEGEEAIYLWTQVARARLESGDDEGAAKALRRFLKRLPDEDRSDARFLAHVTLAALADKKGDEEKSISWLQKAMAAMPEDPRPYVQLGSYLRQKGHAEEAIEVLETAIEMLDEERPNWTVLQEYGLAKMDAGRDEEAIELLERVVRFFLSQSRVDFPRTTALPLAQLHEKAGRLERAADLYRSLANGSDRENHLEYHREVGRVLIELGMIEEARRMLTRAAALAEKQPESLKEIEAKIAELDAQG